MRITNQMILNNLANSSQAIGKSGLTPEQKALIGKMIEGQIIKADGALLTLNSEGVELSLRNQTDHVFEKGDWVNAEIIDIKEGTLVVNIKPDAEETPKGSVLLSKLNLTASEDNIKLVDALVKNSIPVTKENVAWMKQSMLEVKSLLGEFEKLSPPQKTWVLENMETPVKTLVMQLLEQPGVVEQTLNFPRTPPQNPVQTPFEPLDNEGNMVKDLPKMQVTEQQSRELVALLNEIMSEKADPKLKENSDSILKLLQTFDFEKDSTLLKKELVLNIKNMMFIENELNPVKSIGDSFTRIADVVRAIPAGQESIVALLQALTEDKPLEEKLDMLTKLLMNEKLDDESKSQISKEVLFVKEAVQMTKSTNDTFVMMQIPVMIENENTTVDLYVKTKNKKVDPDEMSLLIALSTHRFGEVRCLINKTGHHYRLDFSFQEEEYKDHFKTMEKELKDAINSLGVQSFDVTFNLSKTDFVKESKIESADFTTIDIRI
ncbi:MAG: hypothetical protein IBX70_04700 [Clostridia bacterium]|nr:hypothetical protein [Clostridia bacterium]